MTPALHNKNRVRGLAIAATVAGLAKISASNLSVQFVKFLHITAFGTWFGTIAYTTFVAGITMFRNLPRQTFGKLQSKLFPL